ncbi:hypothetical protein ACQ4M3_04430 [Leptolyngbya sp. AN03gr2]|uniref:hypothetical protein n=1 Tax=unclassified Leptolyngbya TaxID=2650499 RepID=UPI003D30F283
MNQTVEKWLMIAALTGWIASLGSLIGLAIRASSPAIATRPAQAVNVYSSNRSRPQMPTLDVHEVSMTQIPADTSKGYWAESLKARSTHSAQLVEQRSP